MADAGAVTRCGARASRSRGGGVHARDEAILVSAPAEVIHHIPGAVAGRGPRARSGGRVLYVSDEDDVIRTRILASDSTAVELPRTFHLARPGIWC